MYYKLVSAIFICFTPFHDLTMETKQQLMMVKRGIESATVDFHNLEKKLIHAIADKLAENGFQLDQITKVHLKKRFKDSISYYSSNEIDFIINPGIYSAKKIPSPGIENIGVEWSDPQVVETPDGGIEFELGHKSKLNELKMDLFGLKESYSNAPLIENHASILEKINHVFLKCDLEEIASFTSKGIPELTRNYHILIIAEPKSNHSYKVIITKLREEIVDPDYFHELGQTYTLRVNLQTTDIHVLDRFDPTFFPTPHVPYKNPDGLPDKN